METGRHLTAAHTATSIAAHCPITSVAAEPKEDENMTRLHLQVYGRVQGVGFRYACRREADSLGLTGWVRNLHDDCVEIVAEGSASALNAFSVWCGHGPPFAKVERVINTPGPALGEYRTFEIKDG